MHSQIHPTNVSSVQSAATLQVCQLNFSTAHGSSMQDTADDCQSQEGRKKKPKDSTSSHVEQNLLSDQLKDSDRGINQDDVSTDVQKNDAKCELTATLPKDKLQEIIPVIKMRYPEEVLELADFVGTNTHKNHDHERTIETCCNRRFYKNNELISKSKYRTIFKGFDNETGYEIAWSVYSLQNITQDDKVRILQGLEKVKLLSHPNILTCIHYLVKKKELAIVTELITGGSIREYLKKIKQPRLIVLKNWSKKILEGTQYLHSQNFVHGKLTCESIYINSNCGDIKIGDLGIQAIPSYNTKYSETTLCKLLRSEDQTPKFDIFCFGLSFLEMILISSDISGHHTFKQICKVINNKEIDAVLRSIIDEQMRDFLSRALEFDPEKRATITELLEHQFLKKSDNDHDTIKLSHELQALINKHQIVKRHHSKINTGNSQMLESRDSSTANEAMLSQNQSKIFNKICQLQTLKQEKSANNEIITPRTINLNEGALSHQKQNAQASTTINSDTQSEIVVPVQVKKLDIFNANANPRPVNKQPSQKLSKQLQQNLLIQKLQLIQSQKQQSKIPLLTQDNFKDLNQRVVKIKMNILNQQKFQHVSFDYNLDSDSPDAVSDEMQTGLQLSEDDTL